MARFNDEVFEETKKAETIVMKDMFKVTARTVTPLTQMDSNGKQRKRYLFSDGVNFEVPFYSASGFRGASRRIATVDMYNHIKEKYPDFSMGMEEFYLYTNGASTDKKSIEKITWMNTPKIRELAPVLSLWGGGLSAISGKLAMCDLTPSRIMYKTRIDKEGAERGVSMIDKQVFFRGDDMRKSSMTQHLVDVDDVASWVEENNKKIADSKDKVKKAKKEESSKKEDLVNDAVNIQMPVEVDSIMPNVELVSSINTIGGKTLTNVERGLVLKTLIKLSTMQIGANVRYGYGVLDWIVEFEGEIAFTSIVDPDYVFDRKIFKSDKTLELIAEYDKWAEANYTDKIDIDSLLEK